LSPLYRFDPGNHHFAMVGLTLMNFARTALIRDFNVHCDVVLESTVEELGPLSFYQHEMTCFPFPAPSRVRLIGIRAFADCTCLGSIAVPSSVQVIQAGAFYGCYSLQEVRIATGSELSLIGAGAFDNCGFLQPVDVPSAATIDGLYKVIAKVRDVDGSKRQRVRFITRDRRREFLE
jgi:hypothetical protein